MLKKKNIVATIQGIWLCFSLTSCVKTFYPEKIACEKVSIQETGIPVDSNSFEFHRYRIPYNRVLSARIDHKFDRFYVVVHTRDNKTYSFFTHSESQATNIYYLIKCRAEL